MKEQIIAFNTAKLAREKGYNLFEYDTYLKENIIKNGNDIYIDTRSFSDKYYAYVDGELHLIETGTVDSRYGSFKAFLKDYMLNKTNDYFQAPTQSLLQKWLRDNHIIVVNGYSNASGYLWEMHYTPERGGTHIADSGCTGSNDSGTWNTYEEALEKGLYQALKLIEI